MFKIIKNKKLRIFIIVNLILILIAFIIVFIFNRLKDNYRSLYKTNDELVTEEVYYNIFNELDIETKMTDIYIKQNTENNIKVIVYGEKDYIKLSEKNNKLFIDINPKNIIAFDFYKCISKIELYLPVGYSNLIRIVNEFGNIEIENFENATFDIEQEYGNFIGNNVSFVKLVNGYGDVDIKKSIKTRVDAKHGDVTIGDANDLIVENEFGDIIVENVFEHLKLYTENGDIKVNNLVLEKDSFIDANYGDIIIGKTNEIYINAKTDRGKKKINNNYKKADIILKIHNKDGNINVEN